jgi:mono/diheme cytochrome c family protein
MITHLAYAGMIAVATAALAQPSPSASRGELLYNTHCIACHTTEVHWREQKLATDWASLVHQVRRWAGNTGLAWSDEEIADVARYLNSNYYRFAVPSVTGAARPPSTTPAATKASISPSA